VLFFFFFFVFFLFFSTLVDLGLENWYCTNRPVKSWTIEG